jgi:Tfp pilus assembly protein PilN
VRLNLASEPFRNETLPAVLLVLGALVLGGITVQHALTIRRLLPDRTSAAHREAAALEAEAARLREESAAVRTTRPEPAVLAQWVLLKDLVDRRAFSWTGLFSVLEQALPPGVRLLSISPEVEKGAMRLTLTAAARSYEQGIELIRILEDRPEFADVLPRTRDAEEESRFRYEMRYVPAGEASPMPTAASPAPEAVPDDQEARVAAARGARVTAAAGERP